MSVWRESEAPASDSRYDGVEVSVGGIGLMRYERLSALALLFVKIQPVYALLFVKNGLVFALYFIKNWI